ncbi:MAG: hypothetical protein COC01_08105 [Bacteroidetes bacterium]|nr:hypothetical protein [Bacteroidia bacterium]PCH66387.1 MAG: hypothetical protein COC01_08105 [Bacteroidota bacterium]
MAIINRIIIVSLISLFFISIPTSIKGNSEISLEKIELRIIDSYSLGVHSKNFTGLRSLCQQLEEVSVEDNQFNFFYWKGYANFRLAFADYYLLNNKESALEAIQRSVESLNKAFELNASNNEMLSLLSMALSFNASLNSKKNFMTNSRLMSRAEGYEKRVMIEESANVRSYLSKIMYEYYSASIVGQKEVLEKTCIKALYEAESLSKIHKAEPSWGRSLIYFFLIRHYIDAKKATYAQIWLDEAVEKYPNDVYIAKLNKKISKSR